jgi:hypothetical protein
MGYLLIEVESVKDIKKIGVNVPSIMACIINKQFSIAHFWLMEHPNKNKNGTFCLLIFT